MPVDLNKGKEVKSYRSLYTRKKVEGNEQKQRQLMSLGDMYGLSFRDFELLLP